MKRREFSAKVQKEIICRATRNDVTYCEECGAMAKRFQIDHIIAEALITDKTRKLTAADGQLLCSGYLEACHDKKTTTKDVPAIAEAKRRESAHLGVKRAKAPIASRGFEKHEKVRAINKSELPELPRRMMFR